MNLSNDDVEEILRLLDGLPYDEFSLETAAFRLSLRRDASGQWQRSTEVTGPARVETAEAAGGGLPTARSQDSAVPADDGRLVAVRTPLPGTFYRAPQPGAPPFVEVGSRVEASTVVAIVETMKLMNSITAGSAGVVREICLENARFVERDGLLMRIEADPA